MVIFDRTLVCPTEGTRSFLPSGPRASAIRTSPVSGRSSNRGVEVEISGNRPILLTWIVVPCKVVAWEQESLVEPLCCSRSRCRLSLWGREWCRLPPESSRRARPTRRRSVSRTRSQRPTRSLRESLFLRRPRLPRSTCSSSTRAPAGSPFESCPVRVDRKRWRAPRSGPSLHSPVARPSGSLFPSRPT